MASKDRTTVPVRTSPARGLPVLACVRRGVARFVNDSNTNPQMGSEGETP
jgi:hypothetical protein